MSDTFLKRLKLARTMREYSLEKLAQKLDKKISLEDLYKLEKGEKMPDSAILLDIADALDVTFDYLFTPITFSIDSLEFHNPTQLPKGKILSLKEMVRDQVERVVEIERICNISSSFISPLSDYGIDAEDSEIPQVKAAKDIYPIVNKIKEKWQLGQCGIHNVIETLEDHGVKVVELSEDSSFHSASGVIEDIDGNRIAVIAVNKNFDSEHKRMIVLSELARLVLNFAPDLIKVTKDRLCSIFASEMLISGEVLLQKLGKKRERISFEELVDLQKQYGISIDDLIFKARNLKIITKEAYESYFKDKDERPDYKTFAETSRYPEESSSRLRRLVFGASAADLLSMSKAKSLLGCTIHEIYEDKMLVDPNYDYGYTD